MPGLVRSEADEEFEKSFNNFDMLTIAEVIALALATDDRGRDRIREKEENGKNRKPLVDILRVNWNS